MKKILILFFCLCSLMTYSQDDYLGFLNRGIEAFNAINFEMAINQFKAAKICDDAPSNDEVDIWIEKAQNGYIKEIEKARDKAIVLKKDAEALQFFSIGQEQECKGFFKEAFDNFSKAITIRGEVISYRERRAQLAINEELKEYEIAKEDLEFLIENGEKEKESDYYDNLAFVLGELNEFDAALVAQTSASSNVNDFEQREIYKSKVTSLKYKKDRNTNPSDSGSVANAPLFESSFIKLKPNRQFSGCFINAYVLINKLQFPLINGRIDISDLKPGSYTYEISGNVVCEGTKEWPALGRGTINVRPNSVYYLYWENTKYGKCEMWISNY